MTSLTSHCECDLHLFNKCVEYVDAHTNEVLHTHIFCDPQLRWVKDGLNWRIIGLYGGSPTTMWLLKNPQPF